MGYTYFSFVCDIMRYVCVFLYCFVLDIFLVSVASSCYFYVVCIWMCVCLPAYCRHRYFTLFLIRSDVYNIGRVPTSNIQEIFSARYFVALLRRVVLTMSAVCGIKTTNIHLRECWTDRIYRLSLVVHQFECVEEDKSGYSMWKKLQQSMV